MSLLTLVVGVVLVAIGIFLVNMLVADARMKQALQIIIVVAFLLWLFVRLAGGSLAGVQL